MKKAVCFKFYRIGEDVQKQLDGSFVEGAFLHAAFYLYTRDRFYDMACF